MQLTWKMNRLGMIYKILKCADAGKRQITEKDGHLLKGGGGIMKDHKADK
jgi:hypothetical protein